MTQSEFAKGWKLLILQPWGWRYRSLNSEGKPSEESRVQLELYYSKLKWATPEAWQEVVRVYVEGEEWPSIQALKTALQQINHRYVKALPGRQDDRPAPKITRQEAEGVLRKLGIERALD